MDTRSYISGTMHSRTVVLWDQGYRGDFLSQPSSSLSHSEGGTPATVTPTISTARKTRLLLSQVAGGTRYLVWKGQGNSIFWIHHSSSSFVARVDQGWDFTSFQQDSPLRERCLGHEGKEAVETRLVRCRSKTHEHQG